MVARRPHESGEACCRSVESSFARDNVRGDPETVMVVRNVDDHVYPSPVIKCACLVCVISPPFQKSFRDLIVNVLLLHD